MIKNKSLFVIAIIFLIGITIGYGVYISNDIDSINIDGLFFMIGAVACFLFYTFLYLSLDRRPIFKKIYKIVIAISIILFMAGLLIFLFPEVIKWE